MNIIKGIFRFIIGAIFGLAAAVALTPAAAAFANMPGGNAWLLIVVVLIGAVLGVFAPTVRRAFGRGFLLLGASVFALPLSTMLLSGRVTGDMVAGAEAGQQGMAALGGTIAGTMMTGAAAFIGFFLGAIFLVIGLVLVLGGRREVVVVHQPHYGAAYTPQPPQPSAPMIDAKRRSPLAAPSHDAQLPTDQRVEPKF